MKGGREHWDIDDFTRPGQWIVVELDDEVEYIVNDQGVADIRAGKALATLIRVIDRKPESISVRRIWWAIAKEGVIDYIDAQ